MYGHESNGAAPLNSTAPADKFGVSWGRERSSSSSAPKSGQSNVSNTRITYESFSLDGIRYRVNDFVYIQSEDGPPYVAKIGNLYEDVGLKRGKKMGITWFLRPCEMPEGLPEVEYEENCREVFLMLGPGSKSANNPACVIGKCTVACTKDKDCKTEDILAADHIFYRAFDPKSRKFMSWKDIANTPELRYILGPKTKQVPLGSRNTHVANDVRQRPPTNVTNSHAPSKRPSSKLKSSVAKKRARLDSSDRDTEKGQFKRPKWSASHALASDLSKVLPGSTGLKSMAKSPREIEHQEGSKRMLDHHDGPLRDRIGTPAGENKPMNSLGAGTYLPSRELKRIQSPLPSRNQVNSGKIHDVFAASLRDPAGDLASAIGHPVEPKQRAEDSLVGHQNGSRIRPVELDVDNHPVGESFMDVVERGRQLSKNGKSPEFHAGLSVHQNFIPPVENVSPSSIIERQLSESVLKVDVDDFQAKPSSQLPGSSTIDKGHGDLSTKTPSSSRLGSDLNDKTQPSKSVNICSNSARDKDIHLENTKNKVLPNLGEKDIFGSSSRAELLVTPSVQTDRWVSSQGVAREWKRKSSPEVFVNGIDRGKFESKLALGKPDPATSRRPAGAPLEGNCKELYEPKKKLFTRRWEYVLHGALKDGKALLLQNLDPCFSSFEIEGLLQDLLRADCDVRMLPPKNFTSYFTGEALVLFRSALMAEDALKLFTENLVFWSTDNRPVLASMADARQSKTINVIGFLNADKFASRRLTPEERTVSLGTSHCSQPNTVEYDMGIQWRLLQHRHTATWKYAEQDYKRETDHLVIKPKLDKM